MSKVYIKVSRDQIQSAKALIRLSGGEDKVDPEIVKIAHAERRQRGEAAAT
jgi:hypothetical protein